MPKNPSVAELMPHPVGRMYFDRMYFERMYFDRMYFGRKNIL
jgi:hypothetical protein